MDDSQYVSNNNQHLSSFTKQHFFYNETDCAPYEVKTLVTIYNRAQERREAKNGRKILTTIYGTVTKDTTSDPNDSADTSFVERTEDIDHCAQVVDVDFLPGFVYSFVKTIQIPVGIGRRFPRIFKRRNIGEWRLDKPC